MIINTKLRSFDKRMYALNRIRSRIINPMFISIRNRVKTECFTEVEYRIDLNLKFLSLNAKIYYET